MNIKNIIGLVLLSLVLTACGGNGEADSNSDNPENWPVLGASTFLESESDGHTFMVGLQPTLSMNTVVQDAEFSIDV